jgi:NADPH-dependent glutamate synthase beta subunit-like oxidoreductase
MFADSAFHASPAASPVHTAIRDLLMTKVQPRQHGRHKKVTIIGSGAVGLACAYR